jgi:hypothetical protein
MKLLSLCLRGLLTLGSIGKILKEYVDIQNVIKEQHCSGFNLDSAVPLVGRGVQALGQKANYNSSIGNDL